MPSEMLVGYLGMGVLFAVILYGLYSIHKNALRAGEAERRRAEAFMDRVEEEEAVAEFRRELEERDVALFEIPEAE